MKLQLIKIINPAIVGAIDKLSSEASVPKNMVWPLAKTIRKIKAEVDIWNEVRIATFKKYGEEKDGQVQVAPEKLSELNAELSTILTNDVEIPLEQPISLPNSLPNESKLLASDLAILLEAGIISDA